MKKRLVVAAVALGAIVIGLLVWFNYVDTLSAVNHETSRWAVIEDINSDRLAVEPSSDTVGQS